MKRLLVLRPEPGNRATIERAQAMGLEPVACPLFIIEPVEWTVPDPRGYDAILFTSANALRHGGPELASLMTLPALAVGPVTAEAASAVGFDVTLSGADGVDALLTRLPGAQRLLHLAGAEHRLPATPHVIDTIIVYRAVSLEARMPPGEFVALIHSPRAGSCFAALVPHRATVSIAAISARAAAACGPGWAAVAAAPQPNDGALLAVAARLCQD